MARRRPRHPCLESCTRNMLPKIVASFTHRSVSRAHACCGTTCREECGFPYMSMWRESEINRATDGSRSRPRWRAAPAPAAPTRAARPQQRGTRLDCRNQGKKRENVSEKRCVERQCGAGYVRLDESAEALDGLWVLEHLLHEADGLLGRGDELVLGLLDVVAVLLELCGSAGVFGGLERLLPAVEVEACVGDVLARLHGECDLGAKRVEGHVEALRDLVVLCQARVAQTVLCDGKLLERLAELRVVLDGRRRAGCLRRLEVGQARQVGCVGAELERTAGGGAREGVVERLVDLLRARGGRDLGQVGAARGTGSPRGDAVSDTGRELGDALLELGLSTRDQRCCQQIF